MRGSIQWPTSRFLVIIRDISERKTAEQALKDRELELDIKNERLEEMNAALRVLLIKAG